MPSSINSTYTVTGSFVEGLWIDNVPPSVSLCARRLDSRPHRRQAKSNTINGPWGQAF